MNSRRWIERIKKISNKELLRETERKGSRNIIAGEEVLSRISEKKIAEEEKYLGAILENIRVSGPPKTQKEAKKVINETAKLVKERRYLNEKNLSNILRKAEPFIKKQVGRTWLDKEKMSNDSLREIIESIPSLKEEAEERLLKQNPDEEDLYVIETEGEGLLQKEAWKMHWEKGMSIDDACSLIQTEDPLAELTWKMLREKGRIKEIEIEDLTDILKLTSFFEIKREAVEELWFERKNELEKDELILVLNNVEMIRSEDHQEIRKEIGEMLYLKEPSLEETLEIKEKLISPEPKLKWAKRALRTVNKEIREIQKKKKKEPWLTNDWDRKNLEELKELKKKLKTEIEELQKEFEESIIEETEISAIV